MSILESRIRVQVWRSQAFTAVQVMLQMLLHSHHYYFKSLIRSVVLTQGISVEVVHLCPLQKVSRKMQHCVPQAHSTTLMLVLVLLGSTALLVQQNLRSALQAPSVMRPNCRQLNNARTVHLEIIVESSTWWSLQDYVERDITVRQGHQGLTGLNALLVPIALMVLLNLNCVPMGLLGTSLKGCLLRIALAALLGITAKVLD